MDEFDFYLPPELIAQRPAHPRENARLLVYERTNGRIADERFYNLLNYLPAPTTLVLNNSKVEKARLKFGKREVFLIKQVDERTAEALVYPGKDFRSGTRLELTEKLSAKVLGVRPDGLRRLEFNHHLRSPLLARHRQTPFPPYIKPDEKLAAEYQTVYARDLGSKAAPTAGLHFSEQFLKMVKATLPVAEVTLHVGLGTFAPLKPQNLKTGKLHEEHYSIAEKAAQRLNEAKHLTAVGTTTLRALESNIKRGRFIAGQFDTDIFIRPGYKFKAVDALITNFHLPKSSLLMLVAAFAGPDWRKLYEHAIKQKYRFYSFGDAMVIV